MIRIIATIRNFTFVVLAGRANYGMRALGAVCLWKGFHAFARPSIQAALRAHPKSYKSGFSDKLSGKMELLPMGRTGEDGSASPHYSYRGRLARIVQAGRLRYVNNAG